MPLYPNVASYPGEAIVPLRTPDTTGIPNQRGPSCGFYALGYVLSYWAERTAGTQAAVGKPLPPRTVVDDKKVRFDLRSKEQRKAREEDADSGTFTSLRQYGRYHNLTQFGAVFNAEALVRIAEGTSNGDFTGHVCVMGDARQLVDRVKTLLTRKCPVIMPYDVSLETSTAGDPIDNSGKAAHWTTVVGYDESSTTPLSFLHYTWGNYYRAGATAFAGSCCGLTSNSVKEFLKVNVQLSRNSGLTWSTSERDWMITSDTDKFYKTQTGDFLEYRGEPWIKKGQRQWYVECQHATRPEALLRVLAYDKERNMEYNDPALDGSAQLDFSKILFPDYYKQNFVNPGLRGKLVAIYPAAMKAEFAGT